MENILIAFTADTGGLDQINQKLTESKQREQDLLKKLGELNKEYDAQQKALSRSGIAADEYAKKQNKQVDDYNKKSRELHGELNKSKNSIDALSKSQKGLNDQIGNKAPIETSMGIMRKLREEIIALDMAGQNGTETYKQLVKVAGELKDSTGDANNAISNSGSDTQALDSIISGTELIAGGFSVATGAAALFGVGTEDVARMQVRLQSAIAITTGLQSVGNAVQRDGALIQGIVKAQIWARTVAEKAATSGTWAGVVAQKAFNLVAMANPYVLMAVALMTVVGAIWAFNAVSDAQADKQKRINELETLRIQSLENMASRYKEAGADREKVIS